MIACLYPFLWHCGFHLHSRMFDHWFFFTSMTSFVIRDSDTSVCDGISYIKSMITSSSHLEVLWHLSYVYVLAIAINASSSNVSFTPSISNNLWYCFTRALFGSFKMRTKASSSNGFKDTFTGTRPMNFLESDQTSQNLLAIPVLTAHRVSFCPNTSAPNPSRFLANS